MMAMICMTVLTLPYLSAAMTTPSSMAIARKPVTASSRPMMTTVTHAGTHPSSTNMIRMEQISNLSARGSRNFPKLVTIFIKKIGERRDAEKHRCKKARDLPRKIQQENDRNDEKNPGQCKLICQIEHSITRFWRQLLGFYSTTIVKGKEQNSPPQRFCFG